MSDAAILRFAIETERDVVAARQRAREVADLVGFSRQDVIRIATAVSEIARNAVEHGGGGSGEIRLEGSERARAMVVEITDRGPGIPHLQDVWEGVYRSEEGLGIGLVGSRRLMDTFEVETPVTGGTRIRMGKNLPRARERVGALGRLTSTAVASPDATLEEMRQLDRELIRQIEEVRERENELARINKELEDTNRGVVALYGELEDQAARLRQAHELKGQLLSYMSHEFRSHLDSILSMASLLLDRTDGDLTPEQEKQVGFVRKAGAQLLDMVDDLLASARVDAGEARVRPDNIQVGDLLDQLRPLLRPFLDAASVDVVIERDPELPSLYVDDVKLLQILRNLVSNALKFTEQGEVRVSAVPHDAEHVRFEVVDTGVGIAPEDRDRIFRDFGQVESPRQRQVRGTGLGLPLTRKLVELLQGSMELESEVGVGSTFRVVLPITYRVAAPTEEGAA